MLSYYSFISVLLHCLLLCLSLSSSSILLCCPQYVDLPLVMSNQCHDVIHVGRIHCDVIVLPFAIFKHDVVEVDPLLKGCSVLMLDLQILIRCSSTCPDKYIVCPQGTVSDGLGIDCEEAPTNGLGSGSDDHNRVVPICKADLVCCHPASSKV